MGAIAVTNRPSVLEIFGYCYSVLKAYFWWLPTGIFWQLQYFWNVFLGYYHIKNKFWKNLRTLLFHPYYLLLKFWNGRQFFAFWLRGNFSKTNSSVWLPTLTYIHKYNSIELCPSWYVANETAKCEVFFSMRWRKP